MKKEKQFESLPEQLTNIQGWLAFRWISLPKNLRLEASKSRNPPPPFASNFERSLINKICHLSRFHMAMCVKNYGTFVSASLTFSTVSRCFSIKNPPGKKGEEKIIISTLMQWFRGNFKADYMETGTFLNK